MPEIAASTTYRGDAKLRKKIKGLELEVSGLRLVTEVLWEANEIRSGHRHYLPCSAQSMEKRLAKVVAAEMRRLREMFRECTPP